MLVVVFEIVVGRDEEDFGTSGSEEGIGYAGYTLENGDTS